QQTQMNDALLAEIPHRAYHMRIGVSGQQQKLEEQQAHAPYAGRSAKPWQNITAHHGLNLKQQKGAEENSDRKKKVHAQRSVSELGGRRGRTRAANSLP